VRQRTLWIAFALVVVAATVVVSANELWFEEGTNAVYRRSDWDWESGGGGFIERIAKTVWFVAPFGAAALAYSAVVGAGARRLSRSR